MFRNVSILLFLSLLVFCFSSSAYAVKIGKLNIKPTITYKGSYDDNIYKEATNEISDYISVYSPSLSLSLGKPETGNYISAGIDADFADFSDKDKNNYQTYKPYFAFSLSTPGGLYFKGEERFIDTDDLYGTENDYNVGTRTMRWINDASITIGFKFADKYTIESSYKNSKYRFDDLADQHQDNEADTYSISVLYRVGAYTSLFGQFQSGNEEYDRQNEGVTGWTPVTSQDNEKTDYYIGARFAPGGKLSGEIKLGFSEIDFDNIMDQYGNQYTDDEALSAEALVGYKMTPKTTLNFNLSRNFKTMPEFGASAVASSFVDTTVGIGMKQQFRKRLSLNLGLDMRYQDYEVFSGNPDKEFDTYKFNARLDFIVLRWLSGGLEYVYEDKGANAGYFTNEYDNNIFTFDLTAEF